MKSTRSAACRIDLSGGTTDLWPLFLMLDGSKVCNFAINKYAHCQFEAKKSKDFKLQIKSKNFKSSKTFKSKKELESYLKLPTTKAPLRLVARVADHFLNDQHNLYPTGNFTLTTMSEIPKGSGLGGSSTLMVAIAMAMMDCLFNKKNYLSKQTLHKVLNSLETQELEKPGGLQDYLPAIYGGALEISLKLNEINIKKIELKKINPAIEKMALIYTGVPHHSGINNWDVYKKFISGNKKVVNSLNEIKHISNELLASINSKKINQLPKLLTREWSNRKKLSSKFNCRDYTSAIKWASAYGAVAFKGCGAGGGGCLLVYFKTKDQKKEFVKQEKYKEMQIIDFKIEKKGCFASQVQL